MKNFKIYVIFLMTGLMPLIGMSQVYNTDITSGGVATNSPTEVGDTLELSFNVVNFGSSPAHSIPIGDAFVTFSFPKDINGTPQYYQFARVVDPVGNYFNWIYDATENAIVGVNHTAIPRLGNEYVLVKFLAIAATPSPTPYSALSLQTASSPNDPSNNDFAPQPIIVDPTPASLDGLEFSLSADKCLLNVDIVTQKESNIEQLFVELYNGSNSFESDVEVKLNGKPSEYSLDFDLEAGTYLVKLRTVLTNGETKYSKVKMINVGCGDAEKVELLENPVSNGNLKMKGLKKGDEVLVYDMLGRRVFADIALSDGQAKLQVDYLNSEMYVLIVKRDQFMIFEQKFFSKD